MKGTFKAREKKIIIEMQTFICFKRVNVFPIFEDKLSINSLI